LFRPGPPRRFRLDDYKRWFPKAGMVFLRYLKRNHVLLVQGEGREEPAIGVVVGPWVSTAAPWYSIMLAIGLARRGRKVVLLWDNTGFAELYCDEQNRSIASVLDYVGQFFPVVRVDDDAPPSPANDDGNAAPDAHEIDNLTDQVVSWCLRGAPPVEADLPLASDIRASLARALPLVRTALERVAVDCLVVPGGVYGTSGLFLLAARERGVRAATFDADQGGAQVCVNGVAAQNADLPRAFDTLWNAEERARNQAIVVARSEFESRAEATDRYGYQTVGAQADAPGVPESVLLPLNVEWDTAALGKHVHFADTVDWVTSTVAAILDANVSSVIVRQHPSERRPLQRSRLDIAAILHDRFGGDSRYQFVAAEDPVNSYDLLRSAGLVLPFTSNIGIEAAAMGKPVLVSGASFYADLGFVWSPTSRDEYFDVLRRGLSGALEPWPDQTDRAWLCYYLVAVRNRIWTDFTAKPDDFWRWCRRSPDALLAEPEVSDILEAIDHNVPVALLRHRRLSAHNGE
jgi:hypothetical protein